VSPLWRDRIHAFLAPGRVDLVRYFRGMKRRQPARHTAACGQKPGLPPWETPLEQLREMLSDAAGTELTVTLSNHFVRYAVIPAEAKIENPAELYAYAAFRMREIFGDKAATWELGVSKWDPSSGGICAAMERDLLERLQALAVDQKVELKGAAPYLADAIDQWCARFDRKKAWFALVETGRFCVASLRDGAWQRISSRRILYSAEDELLATLEQEAILFSGGKDPVEQVVLFAPEHPRLALPSDCGWRAVLPPAGSRSAPPHYPVALHG
jgi:hypothetical protein